MNALYSLVITFGTMSAPTDVMVKLYPSEAACSQGAADYLVGALSTDPIMHKYGPSLYAKCHKVPVH